MSEEQNKFIEILKGHNLLVQQEHEKQLYNIEKKHQKQNRIAWSIASLLTLSLFFQILKVERPLGSLFVNVENHKKRIEVLEENQKEVKKCIYVTTQSTLEMLNITFQAVVYKENKEEINRLRDKYDDLKKDQSITLYRLQEN